MKKITVMALAAFAASIMASCCCQDQGAPPLTPLPKFNDLNQPAVDVAPVGQGDVLGTLTVTQNGETLLEVPIRAAEAVEKLTFGEMFLRLARTMCFCG